MPSSLFLLQLNYIEVLYQMHLACGFGKVGNCFFFGALFSVFFLWGVKSQPFTRSVVVISCYSKTGGFK